MYEDTNADRLLVTLDGNWKSADAGPAETFELINKDIAEGFVHEFAGTMQEAERRWPGRIAKGKLGVARDEGKKPWLALDPTIAWVNPASKRAEATEKPSALDAASADVGDDDLGLIVHVKSAHKQIRLREWEYGLVMFQFLHILYHYVVCHFGASFSDYWWARMGAFIHRLLHRVIIFRHAGHLFVDDWLWRFPRSVAPALAYW